MNRSRMMNAPRLQRVSGDLCERAKRILFVSAAGFLALFCAVVFWR